MLPMLLDFNSMLTHSQCNSLLDTNVRAQRNGLELTPADASDIIESRDLVLKGYGRLELTIEVTKKIIHAVADSPVVNKEDYALTISEIQEIFYYLKNWLEDTPDSELIELIIDTFNTVCAGSIELLQGKGIELIMDTREGYDDEL